MTNRKNPKVEALVVNAIRRLQDVQGSTPREISNYISQEYDVQGRDIKKQVQLALRRGVSYGILQRSKGGYYSCNRDFLSKPMEAPEMSHDRCGPRRKKRRSARRSGRGCKKMSRRSGRSRRRRHGRGGGCKSRSRRRSRRSRRRGGDSCKRRSSRRRRRSRRSRSGKKCDTRPTAELNIMPESEEPKRNESPPRDTRDSRAASPRSPGSSVSGSSNERNLDDNLPDPPPESMDASLGSYIN